MGLREAATVVLLAPMGIGPAEAATLSFLTFAVYTAASLGGMGFYLCGHLPRYENQSPANEDWGTRIEVAAEQRSAA